MVNPTPSSAPALTLPTRCSAEVEAAAPDLDAYDDLDEPPDMEEDLEAAAALIQGAAAAAAPPDHAALLAVSRLESSKVLDENASVQAS